MKHSRKELWFRIPNRRGFRNITPTLEKCLKESGIKEGLLLCNAMHITASVFINDDEAGLHRDFESGLEKLAPEKLYDQYDHNGYEDPLKPYDYGSKIVAAITDGQLDLGPWIQEFWRI